MSPEIAEQIAAIGRVIDPVKTGAIYAPLHDREPYAGVTVTRDIRYGPADRNLLDIFTARRCERHAAGADLRAWRRLYRRQQVDARLAVLRQRAALGCAQRAGRRQHHLSAGAAGALARGRGGCRRSRCAGWPTTSRAMAAIRPASFCSDIRPAPPMPAPTPRCRNSTAAAVIGIAGLILTSGIYDLTDFPLTDNYRSYIGSDRLALCGALADRRTAHPCGSIADRRCGTRSAAFHRQQFEQAGRRRWRRRRAASRAVGPAKGTAICRSAMRSAPTTPR